jgi:Cys-rich repeat protein
MIDAMPGARGVMAVATGVLATACYAPAPPPQSCSESGDCPSGQICDLAARDCVTELPAGAAFVQLDAGAHHACGIDRDGVLWCWGRNDGGQLGVGDRDDRLRPTRVVGDPGWRAVSAGELATCAIQDDGALYCWGAGADTGTTDGPTPAFVPGGPWTAVSVGFEGMCALDAGGQLFCKDDRLVGTPPARLDTAGHVPVQIAVSFHRRCIIDAQQALFCWGGNNQGQVGNGSNSDPPAPVAILPEIRWLAVATSPETTCAIDVDNGLWCWGRCDGGQTGQTTGPPEGCWAPTQVGRDRYIAVDTNRKDTCAVREDGVLVCFGDNSAGQLGTHGDTTDFLVTEVPVVGDWNAIAVGSSHVCGLRAGTEAWCWGTNARGQIGNARGGYAGVPTEVGGTWQSVALGRHSTCGVRTDGSAWCWGANTVGQLGDGMVLSRSRPVRVGRDTDWLAISAGEYHTCGLRDPGALWCWGSNSSSALGDGTVVDQLVPVRITAAIDDYAQVAAGQQLGCALRGGEVVCWGKNHEGTPTPVGDPFMPYTSLTIGATGDGPEIGSACAIDASQDVRCWAGPSALVADNAAAWQTFSAGFDHGCGLAGGLAYCFGLNTYGQLGTGSTMGIDFAQPVVGGLRWSQISAGHAFTCGVTDTKQLYCWGYSAMVGALVAGNALEPVRVDDQLWSAVAAGDHHACAIRDDATLWCWGFDELGELGIGIGGSDRPQRVAPPEGP